MTAWTFTVPRSIPSANAHMVNGNARASAARYRAFRDRWTADLSSLRVANRIPPAVRHRTVTVTRLMGKGQREFDYDNLVAGAKAVIDAMKPAHMRRGCLVAGASLLVDDSPRWVTVTYLQERAADGRAATRITIEDIEPEVQ